MKKNHIIYDILFDRNPKTQKIEYEGKNINLIEYYLTAHGINIQVENQPLILVRKKGPQGEVKNLYFIPELCFLSGLEEHEVKDGFFMKSLSKMTKLKPNDRIMETDEFMNLLKDPDKELPKTNNKNNNINKEIKLSAKEKSELYGIEVKPLNKLFKAYYMKDTPLLAGNNTSVTSKDRQFPILEKKDMISWLCFYEEKNYNTADKFYNILKMSAKSFDIDIEEPEWIEMPNNVNAKDWINTADKYIGIGKKKYSFAVFLIGNNDELYSEIKIHSLCKNGYISQVVKDKTIKGKVQNYHIKNKKQKQEEEKKNNARLKSVCSKILLQINCKLRGCSYEAVIDEQINEKDLMVIGVDSSHIKGKGTGVAMVATMNNNFTDFFNKEEIIYEDNKEKLQYSISKFIQLAIDEYEKINDKKKPKSIIIYRQGVSLQQKDYLKIEIKQIAHKCKNINISFYYILVNTKTTFKFFEQIGEYDDYKNPDSGLLIVDGVTNKNFFEFYIQPQEVTQGSATPTCFHVAYGNFYLQLFQNLHMIYVISIVIGKE